MSRTTNGWRAESFVLNELRSRSRAAFPLAPAYSADILTVHPTAVEPVTWDWDLWEVKSSRNKAQALRAKLTAAEEEARKRYDGRYHVVRVQTFPDGTCVILNPEVMP